MTQGPLVDIDGDLFLFSSLEQIEHIAEKDKT